MYALISSAGGPTVGEAVTKPRQLGGGQLWLNLRTRPAKKSSRKGVDEGYLQVELLDESEAPIAGFAREDCSPVKGDHEAVRVAWKGGDVAPARARRPISQRFVRSIHIVFQTMDHKHQR
jgi:hypothetical protein